MKIEKKLANPKYYGDKRSTSDIKYIVIQTIGNKATPHYYIKESEATQIIPDDYMSDAVNGVRVTKLGKLHGICTKYNSILVGIPQKLSDTDKETCLKLIMTLKQRYKINNDDIVRQTDVTGAKDPAEWYDIIKWKSDIKSKLIDV